LTVSGLPCVTDQLPSARSLHQPAMVSFSKASCTQWQRSRAADAAQIDSFCTAPMSL
jgi:hypothetical protein